jgi:Dimerisation and cyclophilin-binding domain of Mon2
MLSKIYLVTKNQINITTAKATLTQMLNIVFQRMEPTVRVMQRGVDLRERKREGRIDLLSVMP